MLADLNRILCILQQHLVGLFIQRCHGLRLDLLTLEHDCLRKCLLEYRQGDDKCGIDLADEVHVGELHHLDHRDGLHCDTLSSTQILCTLLEHHQRLVQGCDLELN